MTTFDERGRPVTEHTPVDEAVDSAIDEHQVLQDEIERLQQRVADLEMTVQEYRSQMTKVLSSASWKLTSPVRATASRYRTAKVKARRAARRMKNGKDSDGSGKVLTAGLFMPPLESLPETSPLRRTIDVNALRRPPAADGPLHRPEGEPTVLVVAHVHYPELWPDIEDRLVRIPQSFDLIVTITEGSAESAIPRILNRHAGAHIEIVPNKGRDWAPLVRLANAGLLSGYDAIAKVHTKKSEHRVDGDGWRLALLDGVFESPEQIQRTIDLLSEDRSVGLVVPTGHVAGTEHWGSDQPIVEALAYRLPMAFDPDDLRFPAGSMFWCRPWLLERLADLDIHDEHFEPEAGQYDATTAHALERLIGVYTAVAGMDIVEAMDVKGRLAAYRRNPVTKPKIYAFYLPQYHQCPENDEFWGEGFTDWDNVKKAKPLFEGHRQPILPSDEVGFYDLKDPEVLRRQAAMAKEHGIDGFVFHYYWFDGRKVLDTPLNNWLKDPTIDLPLALCWANEPWTRRWDGLDKDVLIVQRLTANWANRFIDDVIECLEDPRYIRVEGRPLLLVYRLDLLSDGGADVSALRRRAGERGIGGLYIVGCLPSRDFGEFPDGVAGHLDALITFPPGSETAVASVAEPGDNVGRGPQGLYSYDAVVDAAVGLGGSSYGRPLVETVMPGWDNTARRGRDAFVFHGSNALTYQRWLNQAMRRAWDLGLPFVAVNAWNEWAEGAALEGGFRPDEAPRIEDDRRAEAGLEPNRDDAATPASDQSGSRGSTLWPSYVNSPVTPLSEVASMRAPGPEAHRSSRRHRRSVLEARGAGVLVVLHVHYEDMWPRFAERLRGLGDDTGIVVSLSPAAAGLATEVRSEFPTCHVFFPDSRGRDIAPFLAVAAERMHDSYDFVLKLHTKKSPHRRDGADWGTYLADSLLGDAERFRAIRRILEADASIGLAVPRGCVGGVADMGNNTEVVGGLLARRGWEWDPTGLSFPAGSMFWARREVMDGLRSFQVANMEFEPEHGQLDGTLAHGMERLVGIVTARLGYRIHEL